MARRPLDVDQALDIAMAVAHGLDRAHRSGIVHRVVKPANPMLPHAGGHLPPVDVRIPAIASFLDRPLGPAR